MSLCSYGCQKEAKFTLKNGKKCCSKMHSGCPALRKLSSERMTMLNRKKISPATKKGFKQPSLKCPSCDREISKGNYKKHIESCGKPKGNCVNCGEEIFTYYKTCSKECASEIISTNRKKQLTENGLSKHSNKYLYMTSSKEILYFDSSFELNAAIILDIWKEQGKIIDWKYNRNEYISYQDKIGSKRMYFPDFKIYEVNGESWLEVKGFKTPTDNLKWNSAKKKGIKLKTWFEKDIREHQNNIDEYRDDKV